MKRKTCQRVCPCVDTKKERVLHYRANMRETIQKRFYLYLLSELFYTFLLSLGVLTFILVLSRLGRLADLVVNKGVQLKDIALLIVYSSPPYLTFTLPMAFLLSTIVVLGRLSTENEILALKASGINLYSLFIPVGFIGAAIAIVGVINTNAFLPRSGELFRETLVNIVKKGVTIEDKEGVFNDTIPGIVIYVDKVDTTNRRLSGIIVSDDRDSEVKQTISASKGIINLDPLTLDLSFVLENGSLHRWERSGDLYRSLSFKNYTFSMNLNNMLSPARSLRKRPWEMDRGELRQALASAKEGDKYELFLEIHKKISIPLCSLSFILLAIPLGIRRKVEGKFSGVIYSLLLFMFYYILMALAENVGRGLRIPPLLAAFGPNLIVSFIGLCLLRNLNDEDRQTLSQRIHYWWVQRVEKA
jgi:lipopolysaccharide export system permease protein